MSVSFRTKIGDVRRYFLFCFYSLCPWVRVDMDELAKLGCDQKPSEYNFGILKHR